MTLRPSLRFLTDFNGNTEEGWNISTLGVGGGTPVRPDVGERIMLFDGEGNSCEATVMRVVDVADVVLVYSGADTSTWQEEYAIEADLLGIARSYRALTTNEEREQPLLA